MNHTRLLSDAEFVALRNSGVLLCRCPGERDEGECPTCLRPRLSAERVRMLQERR